MRTLILIALLLATLVFGVVVSARAMVCETTCDDSNGRGTGSAQCHTRCHH